MQPKDKRTTASTSAFSPLPQALDALRKGRFVIVVDDEDRENEGDLLCAAELITVEKMAFLIRHTGGIVCLALSSTIADQLQLPPMVARNTSRQVTPFTVSIEAVEGVTTGVSAADRSTTVRTAINPVARPEDLSRPGHVFPLRASDGGVLKRAGHTEASIDLCRLAGLREGAVLSELMHDDGTMMRLGALQEFSRHHDIPIVSVADLIAYRRRGEACIQKEAETPIETETGTWQLSVYRDTFSGKEHLILTKGDLFPLKPVLVRAHSECLTGESFHSVHCDCALQLSRAMEMIEREGCGAILYMRQEGRGIGLTGKVRAYNLQQRDGLDTAEANEKLGFPADLRNYGLGAQMLRDAGIGRVRLLTNNPRKIVGLEGFGLEIVERVPLEVEARTPRLAEYLKTKKEKFGHILKHV
jgi:3,4-dihydroxy 2-butanone 4-phosphate synthase/GTP cyclohydrolase II